MVMDPGQSDLKDSEQHVLAFTGGYSRVRAPLETAAGYDVTSVSIPADLARHVSGCAIQIGGHPILEFTPAMLAAIPTKKGQKELLRPFMSRLPLSRLRFHECHILSNSLAHSTLPQLTLKITKTPPMPSHVSKWDIVPMMQPHPHVFDDERCVVTETGLCLAPNALQVGNGMACVLVSYLTDKPTPTTQI